MPYRDKVRDAFAHHQRGAKARGIPFLLTYEQWCTIWMESGKFEERGKHRGQYQMARYGDRGGYEVGNVRICLVEENAAERNQNYRNVGEQHRCYGKSVWATMKDPEAAKDKLRQHMAAYIQNGTRPRRRYDNPQPRDSRGWFVARSV